MKKRRSVFLVFFVLTFIGCFTNNNHKDEQRKTTQKAVNVLFLHHSTGNNIYRGDMKNGKPVVQSWFENYNNHNNPKIHFKETYFPSDEKHGNEEGYGWNNYPYDYYNIWVKHGNETSYKWEPTLKTLTPLWDVIVFKHCFPASNIVEDGKPNINSDVKTLANYKLQYLALKKKLHEYPDTKFILWTGAALTKEENEADRAKRAQEFFSWVKQKWDEPGDNIYIWNFYELETEGGLYLKDNYAQTPDDSHPNEEFSTAVAPLFCQRVVDVITNNGTKTDLQGRIIKNR